MTEKQTITEEITAVIEEIIEDEPKKEAKEIVTMVSETELTINQRQYRIVTNYRDGFDAAKLGERYSEVLSRYDYIVGDWGYDQLRLKGFFDATNRKAFPEQRIDTLEDYLYEYCNFGCAYFVLQRIGGKKDKPANRRRKKKPTNQAHVAEKKEIVAEKSKPVIKTRKPQEKKTKPMAKKKNNDRGFTIRQREET